MKSSALCPVSNRKINERIARLNAVFTLVLLLIFVVSRSIYPVIFLGADFLIRTSEFSRFSPVGFISKGIASYLSLNENLINAGPKIFAARIGFVFSSLIITSLIFNVLLPSLILAGILGLFSFLEAAFGICVACEIYPYIYHLTYKTKFKTL